MLQYMTKSIPNVPFRGVKKKEFFNGLTVETCNKAVAPIGQAISEVARSGWVLQSIYCLPQRVSRKKGFFELLLGWIPILGNFLFPTMRSQCSVGQDFNLYILVFVREG